MNDDSDFDPDSDELLVIEPRSPGERWAESGRAGLGRMQASFQGQRLAVVASCWMVGIALLLGAQVWQALHLGSRFGLDMQNTTWLKMMFLVIAGAMGVHVAIHGYDFRRRRWPTIDSCSASSRWVQ